MKISRIEGNLKGRLERSKNSISVTQFHRKPSLERTHQKDQRTEMTASPERLRSLQALWVDDLHVSGFFHDLVETFHVLTCAFFPVAQRRSCFDARASSAWLWWQGRDIRKGQRSANTCRVFPCGDPGKIPCQGNVCGDACAYDRDGMRCSHVSWFA